MDKELREKIARVTCCFAEDNNSCAECKENTPSRPFPDCFEDIRTNTDIILALFGQYAEAIRKEDRDRIFKAVEGLFNNPICKFKGNYFCLPKKPYQALKDKEE